MKMHVSLGIYIESTLLFLGVLAYPSVLPRRDEHSRPDEIQASAILPQYVSAPGIYKSQHVSIRSTDAIARRDDEQGDSLRIRRIVIVTASIPIVAAAHSLERFYNAILFNALAPWCSLPPQRSLQMTMGPLQLSMEVVDNYGIPQGIPWAFVRNFARNMLAMTALGFTGTFNMYYDTDGSFPFNARFLNFGVDVRLRILWGM